MDKSKLVITIERQYGSGGRIVGKKLAEELGIPFYDDEILSMTAEKSAVGEKYFRLADEKAGNNLLRKIVGNLRFPAGIFDEPRTEGDVTSPDNLFTGKEWEDVTNYDLPINASKLELDQVVELIKDYIRMIGYDI